MVAVFYFFFNDTATTEIYTYGHTLSLHDALPISDQCRGRRRSAGKSGGPRRAGPPTVGTSRRGDAPLGALLYPRLSIGAHGFRTGGVGEGGPRACGRGPELLKTGSKKLKARMKRLGMIWQLLPHQAISNIARRPRH